jgi:hypothetical protein
MFQTKVVEKIKTRILCSIIIFPKSCILCDNVEKKPQSRKGHTRLYGACALHAGYRRLQTYIQNTYLLSFPIVQPTRCTGYLKLFMTVNRSTCYGRSFHLSSGAQKFLKQQRCMSNSCCYLLHSGMRSQQLFDLHRSCIRSFELLMMDGKTVRNM